MSFFLSKEGSKRSKINVCDLCYPQKAAIKHSPERRKSLKGYVRGCSKQEEGKLDEAVKFYLEAVHQDPTHIEASFNLAR